MYESINNSTANHSANTHTHNDALVEGGKWEWRGEHWWREEHTDEGIAVET